jgi:tRNA threonylcarbamoyladenosine biosynthesis protein TsaE
MTGNEAPIQLMSNSVQQTMAIAAAVGRSSQAGDLVGLIGELGAGKTQFVRGLATGLDISPRKVSSPTFVFLQEYQADEDDPDTIVLAHIDAYRLAGPDDLQSIGWDGQGQELRNGAVLAVEWADRIQNSLGPDWLRVSLQHADTGRIITLSPQGNWRDKMPLLHQQLKHLAPPKEV